MRDDPPMRIHVMSDLHLEFSDFTPPVVERDVVILAGDIDVGDKAIGWAIKHFAPTPVIYVLGNHEYYGKAFPRLREAMRRRCEGTNVHLLDDASVEIGGVVFLGATLWTDFELFGDPRLAGDLATRTMTDFRKIRISPEFRRLRSIDTVVFNHRSRRWLSSALAEHAAERVVVVTHHAPSARSIPLRYTEDPLSAAYASHLDHLVLSGGPRLWVHGHIHDSMDYMIGATRVLCNPRGYMPQEPNNSFDPAMVVELDG